MPNKQVSSSKFQAQIAKYIDDALRGEETTITRWGRPVAVLKPIESQKEKGASDGKGE